MDDSPPDVDGNFEVGGTGHSIQLVQVVGHDTLVDKLPAQLRQRFDVVIDAAQQDGLVEQRDAGIHQAVNRQAGRLVQFSGMINVDHDDRSQPGCTQQVDQPRGHSLGNNDRQPRVDPQPPQMVDLADTVNQLLKPFIGNGQRITAAEDQFFDFVIPGQRVEGRLTLGGGPRACGIGKVAAETVAAVNRAGPAGD